MYSVLPYNQPPTMPAHLSHCLIHSSNNIHMYIHVQYMYSVLPYNQPATMPAHLSHCLIHSSNNIHMYIQYMYSVLPYNQPATMPAHLSHCLVHSLLVTVHISEGAYLGQVDRLAVTQGNDFVECKYQLKGIVSDIVFH